MNVQEIKDKINSLSPSDPLLMEKMNELAKQLAEAKDRASGIVRDIIDPADAFTCEGCQ